MWGAVFVFFVALLTGTVMSQVVTQDAASTLRREAAAVAGNMLVYRNAVAPYGASNPAFTGVASDANLSLPAWYSRLPGVANYVTAGSGYVYFSGTSPELAYQILKASDNSINVGIKQGGTLRNPLSTTNTSITIAVPTAIPEGSVVFAP